MRPGSTVASPSSITFVPEGADFAIESMRSPAHDDVRIRHVAGADVEQMPKLVIAALNGHTVGGGLEIAMAADMRIAMQGAGKVGLPEVSLGVLPGTGGTQRLSRIVGKTKAIELMIEGGFFDFEEAQRLGIINYVWPAEQDGKKWWDCV